MQILPNKLYSVAQVREMDRQAIEDYAISGLSLMQKAGKAVFELIQARYPRKGMVIFCGAGNNAGDGYVIATLAAQAGVAVKVYCLSDPCCLKADAAAAYQRYVLQGGQTSAFNASQDWSGCIIVDALFGTGLNRDVTGQLSEAIAAINLAGVPIISVDIPSGLNADTGAVLGCAVKATITVSFIALKQGMFTGFAAEHCGEIVYSDLDIADEIFQAVRHTAKIVEPEKISQRDRCGHKGIYGHVLLVGGDTGFLGAIRLSSEAALRSGAGLVSVATRKNHMNFINIMRPEVMSHGVESGEELDCLLNKASVVVIGPGLGQSLWAINLFEAVMGSNMPLVVDADALNLLAQQPVYRKNWVLTPHPGEAARLLNCSTQDIAANRFEAISQMQAKYGGTIVLKGAGTLIDNGEQLYISTTGNPGMATGGMGDVLAGMVASLVAQKWSLADAARAAVYNHGLAADLAAKAGGERGMLASDLMVYIRELINK